MSFRGTKEEYIAQHEKVPAWSAILLAFSQMKKLPETIELQELRKSVEVATGYPFSQLAIRLALTQPTFELAEPISANPKEKYFRVHHDAVRHYIDIHSTREENRLARLMKHPHDSFRAEVNKVRKDAAAKYDRQSKHGPVFTPFDNFTDYSFEYLKSALAQPRTRSKLIRRRGAPNWQMIGVIVAVVIGILAIVATLYAGNKL